MSLLLWWKFTTNALKSWQKAFLDLRYFFSMLKIPDERVKSGKQIPWNLLKRPLLLFCCYDSPDCAHWAWLDEDGGYNRCEHFSCVNEGSCLLDMTHGGQCFYKFDWRAKGLNPLQYLPKADIALEKWQLEDYSSSFRDDIFSGAILYWQIERVCLIR